MKKLFFLLPFMAALFSCSSMDDEYVLALQETVASKSANTTIEFSIVDEAPTTRSADVGEDKWPSNETKTNALTVVSTVYSTPLSAGLSFFTDNYNVKLTNDKATADITSWNGSTQLSLTEKNNISVTLTEKTVGKHPKFKTATGWIDISKIDLDSSEPSFGSECYGGDIVIKKITVSADSKVNVTIKVNLSYDSYLLVAPDASWSILTNVKGFKSLKWGGKTGTSFYTQDITGGKWFYYWGTGDEYIYGTGTLLTYGFNLYSTTSTSIHVDNGKWYALFASLSSVGEGDDDPGSGDSSKTHEVGGANGIEPTTDDIVSGGVIR